MSQHLKDVYHLRQKEIIGKLAELDENIGENDDQTKRILASLQSELEKLQPFIEIVSPEISKKKKKVTFLSATAIANEVYSEGKNMKAQKFLAILQKRKEYGAIELMKKQTDRERHNKEKLDMMRRDIEKMEEKEREEKFKSHNDILIEMKRREEERIKNLLEWKEFYCSYKQAKPLFTVKEERFKMNEEKYKLEIHKIIEERHSKAQPLSDNLFKDHIKIFNKNRESSLIHKELKKIERISGVKSQSVSYYHSKFHEIFKNEEQLAKSIENIKQSNRIQHRDKQIEYGNHVKHDIVVKTKKWDPELAGSFAVNSNSIDNDSSQITRRRKSVSEKNPQSPKKIAIETMQELNAIGNKNLEFFKSLKKKSRMNRNSITERKKGDADLGTINQSYDINTLFSSIQTGTLCPDDIPLRPSKINYLPVIRDKLKLNNNRKDLEWIEVMNNSDLNSIEKYREVKIKIKQIEENASMVERNIKHADNDFEKISKNKDNLDNYYLSSIKAKIALLNGVGK